MQRTMLAALSGVWTQPGVFTGCGNSFNIASAWLPTTETTRSGILRAM